MENPDPKKLIQMMLFMVVASGQDITTPMEIMERKSSLKATDDDMVDISVIVAKSENKEEIMKFLMMQFLPITQLMRLNDWLQEHIKELLNYIKDHPDCQDNRTPEEKSEFLLKTLFFA